MRWKEHVRACALEKFVAVQINNGRHYFSVQTEDWMICEIGVYPSQSLYIRGYAYTWFRTFSCHRKKARNTSVVYGNYDNAAFFFTTIASNYLVTLRALIRLQNLTEILLLFAFLQGDGVHRYMSNFFFWWKPYNHEKGLMSFSHLDKLISVTVIIAETI